MKNWYDIKEYLISVYGRIVLILTCLSLLAGLFMSFVFASMGYTFSFGIFLFGIVVTIFTVALTCGLLLIQVQNNELLKEIQKSTKEEQLLKILVWVWFILRVDYSFLFNLIFGIATLMPVSSSSVVRRGCYM